MPRSAPAAPPQGWHAGDQGFTSRGSGGGGGSVTVVVDPDHPRGGLRLSGPASADAILGLDIDGAAIDHWVRGDDLSAVYEPVDARRLRASAMWRRLPPPDATVGGTDQVSAWLLVASAQTGLLDSDPRLDVVSRLSGGVIRWGHRGDHPGDREVVWRDGPAAGTHAVLVRESADRSILIAVHPGDYRGLDTVTTAGRTVVRCGLFGDSLEKGVLLRGRVLGAIGPRAGDEVWAGRLIDRFVATPPPLTT